MADVRKLVKNIYRFDLSECTIEDGNEIYVTSGGINEFVNAFRKNDLDSGIIVTPGGYSRGLVYKSSNGGEFYNKPEWMPDVVTFSMNVFGLKRGAFYRLTVISRTTHKYNRMIDVTDDRSLEVSNDNQELLINEDVSDVYENKQYSSIFRAISNEINLFFRIGKIFISDIIIDEVELLSEEVMSEDEITEEEQNVVIEDGHAKLAAYGIFSTIPTEDVQNYKGRYLSMTHITGKGLSLYYDTTTKEYVLERDNIEDTLTGSLTGIEYLIDFNFNKVVSKRIFSGYRITEVSTDLSPNTLKQGYIRFEFVDNNGNVVDNLNNDGRFAFIVNKIL